MSGERWEVDPERGRCCLVVIALVLACWGVLGWIVWLVWENWP